ncbi:RNA polymerase sigma factor [Prosthecobacter sp.]|uniref:RNA polymerase sigma factor n=1 Tax=Prosthecobacter sp. TaxID=1965333 RepID=UPI003784DC80
MHLGEDHAPSYSPSHSHTTDSSALNATSLLYSRHWPVLCAFARARGCEMHDAEDAVQELFAKLVAQGQHERAAAIADHGEQAAFLFARLRTHLIKRWQHRTRQRRGGGAICFSLSDENGENIDVADTHASPSDEMDRDWARGVIERALHSCCVELRAQGRGEIWSALEENLVRGCRAARPQSGALRTAVHRAKRRLRALILAECREDEGTLHAVLA